MSFLSKHSTSTVASVALHTVIAGFLMLGFRMSPRPSAAPQTSPIEAVVVNDAAVQREMARIEELEQAEIERRQDEERQALEAAEAARLEREREQERLAQLQREREAAEEADRVRAVELQAQQQRDEADRVARAAAAEEERIRLADLERQREAEERRLAEETRQREEAERQRREEEQRIARERAAEEERRRQEEARKQAELEAQLTAALAVEEEARFARESGLLDEYIRNIQNQIQQRWIRPPSAGAGLECVVNVTQIISGDVTSVSIGRCNGDDAVIRSIEAAVYRASPLPRPPVPSLFNRNLAITFRPDN